MHKTLLSLLLATAVSSSAFAADGKNAYVGAYGILGFAQQDNVERFPAQPTPLDDSSDSGGINGGVGAWLGYDWKDNGLPIRTELAATWRYRHDMNILFTQAGGVALFGAKSDISTTDVVASVLYDIPVSWAVKPYIGAGIGAVYADVDTYSDTPGRTTGFGTTSWDLAWQVQAGANYALSTNWDFRVDYRYVDLGTIDTGVIATGERFEADIASHDLRLGAVWKF